MEFLYGDNIITCDPTDINSVAKQVDLDWRIVQQPACYFHPITNELIKTDDCYTLRIRGNEVTKLSISGKDYDPVEPRALLDVIAKIAGSMNLEIKAAGHTREGKYIYALCSMGDSSKIKSLTFNQYLLISTSNDGNQKTRLTPVCINNECKVQLPVLESIKPNESSETISHHYHFDSGEIALGVMGKINSVKVDYEKSLSQLSQSKIKNEDIEKFHDAIYRRFKVGAGVKKEYSAAMAALFECYERVNEDLDDDVKGTLLALWVAFNHYFDNIKSRRGGNTGKIHSINFGADEKTKREAFSDIMKMYAVLKPKK